MAHGVAVEAADAVNPARPAERAAVNQVGTVMRLTAALEAEAGADFSAGTGGTRAADIVESAARGIGGRDGGAAAADGLDALERGVGAVEVGGVVVAEGDVGDRQTVLLHGDVVLAGGAIGAVGGDAARVNHAANFAEGGIHEHPGDLEQHIVGAEIDLLGEIRGGQCGDGRGSLFGFSGIEDPGDDKVLEFDGGGRGDQRGIGGAAGRSEGGLGGKGGSREREE